jgi:sigma-B regulation protein RsbU (phosphoserine phosphatase)
MKMPGPENHKKLSVVYIDGDKMAENLLVPLLSTSIKKLERVGDYSEALEKINNGGFDLIAFGSVPNGKSFLESVCSDKSVEQALLRSEKELRRRTEIIEQDLKNAQLIQNALLPSHIPSFERLKIDYRYLPLETVGGDYFSFTMFREGGLGVFLGDIMGHGVSAALFLALVKAFADRSCRLYGLKPGEFMTRLNSSLLNNMTTHFLTAVYGRFHYNPKESGVIFNFTKGGHPPPILFRKNTSQIEILNSSGGILGISSEMEYEEHEIYLQKGDRLFLYTDGAYEMIDPENNLLGIRNLCSIMKDESGLSLGDMLSNVETRLEKLRGDSPIMDDVVIIGFEVTG